MALLHTITYPAALSITTNPRGGVQDPPGPATAAGAVHGLIAEGLVLAGVQGPPQPGPVAPTLRLSAISPAQKQTVVVLRSNSLLAKGARQIRCCAPPFQEAAAVELMVAVQHAHARVFRAAGAAATTAAGRVVRCAVGWRRESIETYRAARLGRSSHLDT